MRKPGSEGGEGRGRRGLTGSARHAQQPPEDENLPLPPEVPPPEPPPARPRNLDPLAVNPPLSLLARRLSEPV